MMWVETGSLTLLQFSQKTILHYYVPQTLSFYQSLYYLMEIHVKTVLHLSLPKEALLDTPSPQLQEVQI